VSRILHSVPGPARAGRNGVRNRRIAVLGGGNGISLVLRGFADRIRAGENLDVTAVVSTADDGGSSGRLRRERGGPPPGDLRNCLLALSSGSNSPLTGLFEHRYRGNGSLAGHSLGNLILEALVERKGDIQRAVDDAGTYLGAAGRVLPVSLDDLHLEGEGQDGTRYSGESNIGNAHRAIHHVWLEPGDAVPAEGVLESIRNADLLVLGPGSMFTSLVAVLLVPGVARAFRECRGRKVLVANLMTQPGETPGMDLADHLGALDRHVGPGFVDSVLAHRGAIDPERLHSYRMRRSEPVPAELPASRTETLIRHDLVTDAGKIRHDSGRMTGILMRMLPAGLRRAEGGAAQEEKRQP
jgi:uncharacterized cofD-like protein